MKNAAATLVGDGIENPGNALVMLHAAEMFGVECRFRDTKGLRESELLMDFRGNGLPVTTGNEIKERNSRVIAFDNLPGAADVFGFNTECTWGQIQINLYNPTSHHTWYQDNSRWVLCQEMGHALGLDHTTSDPDTSCMENTYNSGEDLTSHDTTHIDANY